MRRMYVEGEEIFYYLTLYNENYPMPAIPKGAEEGILKGLYKYRPGAKAKQHKAHLLGSGSILNQVLEAQKVLAERYDVSADVWSATSYKTLRTEAMEARRWNMLHPTEEPKRSYLESILKGEEGVFVAASDYVKAVCEQIAPWVPGGLTALGTDGFGRSDTRKALRRFFEVDTAMIVVATLYALAQKGKVGMPWVAQAIDDLGVDPEKLHPQFA